MGLSLGRWNSIRDLEKLIDGLMKKHGGFMKVNLVHADGENEGIWAVPLTAKDAKLLNGDSYGKFAYVRLVNQPLGWGDRLWGSCIKVKTNGHLRAFAYLQDQDEEDLKSDLKHLSEVQVAYFRELDESEKRGVQKVVHRETAKSRQGRGKQGHG